MNQSCGQKLSVVGRLFQAAMWRKYAVEWDSVNPGWVQQVLRVPRSECLRRARVNVRLARRLNRLSRGHE